MEDGEINNDLNWECLEQNSLAINGASAHFIEDHCFIIGGFEIISNQIFLRISCFSLSKATWITKTINTDGIINRAFHASCTIGYQMCLIGGVTSSPRATNGSEMITDEVIICTETDEGICCIKSRADCGPRKGMTASSFGAGDRVILFGGQTSSNAAGPEFPTDLWIFSYSESTKSHSWLPVTITDGETPPGRAFHSAVVCNKYLIISGGIAGKTILNDVWLLDLTTLLPSIEPEVLPVKGNATIARRGSKSKINTLKWVKIETKPSPILTRYFHKMFAIPSTSSSNDSFTCQICIFGGVGECSRLGLDISTFAIETNASKEFSIKPIPKSSSNYLDSLSQGSTAVAVVYDESSVPASSQIGTQHHQSPPPPQYQLLQPIMVLLFGGRQKESPSLFLPLCPDHPKVKKLMSAIDSLSVSPEPLTEPDVITRRTYPDGSSYEGELVDDYTVRHGNGKMSYADGTVYEGEWINDLRDGRGKLTLKDNSYYIGDFLSDIRSGQGELFSPTGALLYSGAFSNDTYEGFGKLIDSSGCSVYEGLFENGKKHGQGVLTCSGDSGSSYDGDWVSDIRTGRGLMKYPNGDIYEGGFLDDKRNGRGTCRFVNGSEYRGSWRSDKMNGYGTFVFPNLDEYQGKWVSGKRCGKGIWRTAHGNEVYDGLWDNDLPHGNGIKVFADGSRYEGDWVRGKRNGEGFQRYADGSEYSGFWLDDCRYGPGCLKEKKGCREDGELFYDGEWEKDMRHGTGKSYYDGGATFKGKFVNDFPISTTT